MKTLKKIIAWGAGIAILGVLVISSISFFVKPGTPPDITDVPWAVQTYSTDGLKIPSRVYYGEKLEYIDGSPSLTGWWSFDGKNYHRHKGTIIFSFDMYGKIDIKRR